MLENYQNLAMRTAAYPEIGSNIFYPSMGLCGEISELLEKIEMLAKPNQPNKLQGSITPSVLGLLKDVGAEIGDVMWFVAVLAREAGIAFETVCSRVAMEDKSSKDMIDNSLAILHGRATRSALLAGELSGKSSKIMRDKLEMTDYLREVYRDWLTSITYHMWAIAHGLRMNLSDLLQENIDKLAERLANNKIHGEGDHR